MSVMSGLLVLLVVVVRGTVLGGRERAKISTAVSYSPPARRYFAAAGAIQLFENEDLDTVGNEQAYHQSESRMLQAFCGIEWST